MSSFKYKPEKLKYLSSINTLDELHKKKVDDFNSKKLEIPKKKEELRKLNIELQKLERNSLFNVDDIKKKSLIKDQIEKITEDLYELENGINELDYYSRAGDILIEYYNIVNDNDNDDLDDNFQFDENNMENDQCLNKNCDTDLPHNNIITNEKTQISQKLLELNLLSQQKRKIKKPTRKRTKRFEEKPKQNILSFFSTNSEQNNTETDSTINSQVTNSSEQYSDVEQIVSNKATLFDDYMTMIDRSYVSNKIKSNPIRLCLNCNIEKTLIQSEGSYVCQNCGETEHIIVESEIPNHKDATSEKPKYPYKRMNHLIEWLNQFQAKESTEIPENIYNDILQEIKQQRLEMKIKNMPYIKQRIIIKNILKKLRYTQYYEHIPFIISKVTHKPPPILSRDIEDKIKVMFKQIQEPFNRFCPPDRINFLNYSYILNKLFKILKMDEYAECFTLLKSRDKLRQQDEIWKNICKYLNWDFYPSI